MANITISWNADNTTLTASPSPCYAGAPGQGAVSITWSAGTGVGSINGVTISKKNSGSYDGTQPSQAGASNQWTWSDPDTATNTYEYVVSASVTNVGVRTLDPQIINTTPPTR